MKLRKLEEKDAELMLEWMHDPSVVGQMGTDFSKKTLADCIKFIKQSQENNSNFHMAVVDSKDEYMGTVSLKGIDFQKKCAEFAITVRKSAMGAGYAAFGMREILQYGFNVFGLKSIYWCVSPKNVRAVRFYDKNNYQKTKEIPHHIIQCYPKDMELIWYVVKCEEKNN